MRLPTLKYERGTLILHPPPKGKKWLDFATWDDRSKMKQKLLTI